MLIGDGRCAETGEFVYSMMREYLITLFVILLFSIILLKRKSFGKCISDGLSKRAQAYRIGGDEFIVLCFSEDATVAAEIEKRIYDEVKQSGYSIAVGHAVAEQGKTLDEVIKESDNRMYENKDEFYRQSGAQRRRL